MGLRKIYEKGQKYNHITLIQDLGSYQYNSKDKCRIWKCLCDCGNEFNAYTRQIKNGLKTCGCNLYRKTHKYPHRIEYEKGQRFNNYTIVERSIIRKKENKRSYTSWKCLCDCGVEFITSTKSIQRNRKSCGCLSERKRFRPFYENDDKNFMVSMHQYKGGAKERKLNFELNFEQCKKLFLSPCHYCSLEPRRLVNKSPKCIPTAVNGIDRIDNKKGYHIENVVSCCTICNRAKSILPYSEYMEWISRIKNGKNNV